ncbi:hypothetical protein Tco_0120387 [Tanacetum coccineum]
MAALESCPNHNMVAYLEKTEGNAPFHEIVDFLREVQFSMLSLGKTVLISEASIRRDLLFNDVDGIGCLTNSEIYENLQLMGYKGDLTILTFQKALFSPQ